MNYINLQRDYESIGMSLENKKYMNNSIFTIFPYKIGNLWVFDDEKLNLYREAFVSGSSEFLDMITINPDNCTIVFSDKPFPSAQYILDFIETIDDGVGGTTYYCEALEHTLWLCSVLKMFFSSPPLNIYIQVK